MRNKAHLVSIGIHNKQRMVAMAAFAKNWRREVTLG
jgi:hypothetical protein